MKTSGLSLGGPEFSAVNSDGTVTIADSNLLLSGTYSRDGDDLVLTGSDGQQLQIVEYFSQSVPPTLISSDGKMLSGDTVSLLAGPQAPGQYAQSTGGQFGDAIGQVETLDGSASAQRPNGLIVELEVGSHVFQGDVVSAGANSTLGITFLDKTVFTIAEGGTMVLNEMVYNPSGSSNSMLFNLLGGTAAFVAGAVAKSGDVKIETPVAVMAIRGTEPFASCQAGASCYFGGASGKYDLLHKVLGQVLATVDNPSRVVTLDSINGTPSIAGANALQQLAMGRAFQSLRDAVKSLEDREADGEDPVREAGTGSPDFANAIFMEDIGGFFFAPVNILLSHTALIQTPEEEEENEPLAPPDPILTAGTNEDTSFIFEVITEDDVLGLGPAAFVISATVTSGLGTATPSEDRTSVLYDPGDAYNGLSAGETADVQVTVVIDLGDGTTQTQTAFITVLGINDLPDANPDTATTSEGTLIGIDVLNNDTDPDTNDDLVVSNATIVSGLGDVSIAADGYSIIYDPRDDYDFLSAGETGQVVIQYQISDGHGGFSTSTATVTVTGLNADPDFETSDTTGRVTERVDGAIDENDIVLISSGIIGFSDVDSGDDHIVSFEAAGSDYRGTFTAELTNIASDDGDGEVTWEFSINDADIDDLAAGQTLVQVYTITIDDGNGGVITKNVTVRLVGSNDAPVTTGTAVLTGLVTELADGDADENDFSHSASGQIAFADVDLTDTHDVTVVNAGSGYIGSFVASVSDDSTGDGSGEVVWNFTIADEDLDSLGAKETLTQIYTLTIDDGNGGTTSETVTVTIQGTNDEPVITAAVTIRAVDELGDGEAGENTLELTAAGTIVFDDVDVNDTHVITVSSIGPTPFGGLTTVAAGGVITWTYAVNDGKLDSLAEVDTVVQSYLITIDDGQGGTDSQIVDITLTGTNDVAIITGTTTGTVIEDDAVDTFGGLLDVVDPDIRQDGTVEAAFVAVVIMGTYGTFTIDADGVWSYTLDNSLETTDGLVFGDEVTDSFTVSTIDGATQAINIAVTGVGFDFEFSDFGGNSGSSAFKSIDAGTIDSVEIDLLITPMPLTIISAGDEVANKVNATQSDLGVGPGQDIADDEGLRFEFITGAEATNQNNIATLSYISHISLVLFQAEVSQVQGNQDATASILLRIVNADDDKNFDTMDDDGDIVIALSVDDVSVNVADGNDGNYEILQVGDTVVITGLQEGDSFTIDSSTAFNRVEVENVSEIYGGSTFEVGLLGFNMPDELMLVGDGTSTPLIGAESNDTLNSGPGQQELTGGGGVDVFVFDSSASMGALADIIIDYEAGVDVVDLSELFDLSAGDFTEAAVEEFVRYISGDDNDGGSDPSGSTGDLFIDLDGDANGENFILLAHSNTQTDSLILKVDDGTDIGYVTIV